MIKYFMQGFIQGVKETPRMFFAPAVAVWRLLRDTTESLASSKSDPNINESKREV